MFHFTQHDTAARSRRRVYATLRNDPHHLPFLLHSVIARATTSAIARLLRLGRARFVARIS